MKENLKVSFDSLDLGSAKPTSVPMETVEVELSSENLLGNFARAFVRECYRVNPRLAEQVKLTEEEVVAYTEYLLAKRIECVQGYCADYRKLKSLYIPVWIQYNLAMIGEVIIRDKGLRLIPVITNPSDLSFEDALLISDKIGAFEDDLQIVKDAMPRSTEGNRDVMSTALIAGYVRSIEKVEHVASTYVTAFLGMKLKEEVAMQVMYRVQYDDYQFIATALMHRGLFR